MMNRLRCPLAQICQRARAKPSQPRKAMIPGTSGWFSLDHSVGGLCRRDLSSSDVDVSCNRAPPPSLSQREGISWPGAQLTRATPFRCPTSSPRCRPGPSTPGSPRRDYSRWREPRELPGGQEHARVLQLLAARPGRAGGAGTSGQDVPRRPLHRVRLEQEPAGRTTSPVTSRAGNPPGMLLSAGGGT